MHNNNEDCFESIEYEVNPEEEEEYNVFQKEAAAAAENPLLILHRQDDKQEITYDDSITICQKSMDFGLLNNASFMGISSTCLTGHNNDADDDDDAAPDKDVSMQKQKLVNSLGTCITEKEEEYCDDACYQISVRSIQVEDDDDDDDDNNSASTDDADSFADDDDDEEENSQIIETAEEEEEEEDYHHFRDNASVATTNNSSEDQVGGGRQSRRQSGNSLNASLHYEVEDSATTTTDKNPNDNGNNQQPSSSTTANETGTMLQSIPEPPPTTTASISPNNSERAKKTWKKGITRLLMSNTATARVSLDNKIGTPAAQLAPDNPLRFIAMSIQRSIRCYQQVNTGNPTVGSTYNSTSRTNSNSPITAAAPPTISEFTKQSFVVAKDNNSNNKHILHFPATTTCALNGKVYNLPQPSFQCEQVCPEEFVQIRKSFGISERQYHAVLNLEEARTETSLNVLQAKEASGKSGSFFFLSPDQRYIIKSCTKSDVKTLCKILPEYRSYVERARNCKEGSSFGTLLPRYLGLYSLRQFHSSSSSQDHHHTNNNNNNTTIPDTTMVVMTNFFAGSHKIHYKFDLKGSTYKRTASAGERTKKSPVYKDNDWIDMNKKLTFPEKRQTDSIRRQLELDTDFLSGLKLIDYSLLVGIHDHASRNNSRSTHDCLGIDREESMGVIFSASKHTKEIRYFGIVDILTPYRAKKRAETLLTGDLLGRHGISCQPPGKYARRFCDFMKDHVLETEDETGPTSCTTTTTTTSSSSSNVIAISSPYKRGPLSKSLSPDTITTSRISSTTSSAYKRGNLSKSTTS